MVPFDFQSRTRVVFGPGSIERLGPIARDLNMHRALLVADKGVAAVTSVSR
jgi:alcohol dehydrogenase